MSRQPVLVFAVTALLLVGVATMLAPLAGRRAGSAATTVDNLRAAVANERLVEGRITGGFGHGPFRTPTRSAITAPSNLALLAAAGALQKLAESSPNRGNLHLIGVAQLLMGRHGDAIAALEAASATKPDADVLSDSAAAFLARAQTENSPLWDYAKAIDASSRALAVMPSHPEARFNRALALERAHLPTAATQAWNDYLAIDPDSGWALEARRHLEQLPYLRSRCADAGSPRECVDLLRTKAEEAIVVWANASPASAAAALQQARQVASDFEHHTGDTLLTQTIAAIDGADLKCRATLAAAHRQFASARALYESDRRQEALIAYEPAMRDLRDCRSPFFLWADINRAVIDIHARRLADAAAALDRIDAVATDSSYRTVAARSLWLRGIVTLHEEGPAAALLHYRRALDQYASMGDDFGVGNLANAAADSYRIIGELPEGWKTLDRAIATLSVSEDPVRRYVTYYNATLFSLESGLTLAALAFQDEAVSEGRRRSAPAMLLEGLLNRAVVLERLGDEDAALRSIDEAEKHRATLTDGPQKGYMGARLAAVRGQIRSKMGTLEARDDLGAAIDTFRTLESAELPRLFQLRARAALADGDRQAAERDLAESLQLFETRQTALASDQQRISYADTGWTIYQDLIGLRISNGAWEEALQFAETARARTLRSSDSFSSHSNDRLPAGTAILFYLVRDAETVVWTVTASGAEPHRIAASRDDLENRVKLLRWQIEHGDDGAVGLRASLEQLYQLLVAPAIANVSVSRIVVIPDAFLARIPFQALRSRSGRDLVEDVEIAVTPSIGVFLDQLSRPVSTSPLRVLAVGDPAFDATTRDLPRLPRAREEAQRVAAAYTASVLLTDRDATSARLQAELATADVFHFAGHALANVEFPELSRLIVAPEKGKNGRSELSARDIAKIGIRPGALIVLSACRTGEGRIGGAEGPQSLGRAFLAAGAGAVVVSLWDVEDEATQVLFETFHRAYAAGRSPAAALRQAQIEMIRSHRPVRQWAAFHVVTGGRQLVSSLKGAE